VAETVRVKGLNELMGAFRRAEGDLDKELRRELVALGKPVADDARGRLSAYSPRSAAGIRSRLRRGTTVVVEQRKGKTTGRRPDWGRFQMTRVLIPALRDHEGRITERLDDMLDRIGRRWEP
jgi:hypothetical protein